MCTRTHILGLHITRIFIYFTFLFQVFYLQVSVYFNYANIRAVSNYIFIIPILSAIPVFNYRLSVTTFN